MTPFGCVIADIAPAIKPRMCPKYAARHGPTPVLNCAKSETNRIRAQPAPIFASKPSASRRAVMLGTLGTFLTATGWGRKATAAEPSPHAIAMHGEPAWPANFSYPAYANPAARKGGQLVQGVLGTFDSLNPFIVKGLSAANIRGYVIESLLARGYDEPFTLYGLLAESVETDAARAHVTFKIGRAHV